MNRSRKLVGLALLAMWQLVSPAESHGSKPRSPAGDPFSGKWVGRWTSAKHHEFFSKKPEGGPLRCLFLPVDRTHYRAQFHAGWLIFSSNYAATFSTQRRGSELRFQGTQNLGFLFGGVYHYRGLVTPHHFSALYDSSYDRGTFELVRAGQEER